jgi:hypothetical protein
LRSAASQNQDPLKGDVFPGETDSFPEVVVTYRPLKDLGSKIWSEMHEEEQQAVLKTFESVWTKSMGVIFYYTDQQVKENLANGTSAKINEALGKVSSKYYSAPGSPYRFDSKEAFDRDYESKWHYYWK